MATSSSFIQVMMSVVGSLKAVPVFHMQTHSINCCVAGELHCVVEPEAFDAETSDISEALAVDAVPH